MARTPHDLTADDIVLGHFTLGRSYPLRERLAIAAEAGVAGIGLFMGDIDRWASDDELARMLDDHGLLLVDLDLINLAPRDEPTQARSTQFVRRAAELADRFGCRYLQTIAPHTEPGAAGRDETVDALGRVADALAPYGVEVGLEYTGFTTIRTLSDAVSIVQACGRANVGVCVDVWHHTRASGAVELAPFVPAPLIRCVQLNDGPLVPLDPDYKTDCLRNRLAPGAGEMDVAGLVAQLIAMGVDVPWTLEVCRDDAELSHGRGRTHALRCIAAARAVLDGARRTHDSPRTT
ncbi:MAG TPA: sugar phosphate isomerase/epimerase family protein [Ilumatobacter sp.]|nr:sugar phosphate isomerase/epimerase family protein [Ilumatobacter sp.]